MKIIMRLALAVVLLMTGFAAGFPIGQNTGFSTGSDWAFVQANILAREAGLFMPVNYEAGQFTVMMKQPRHLYKSAWLLADAHETAYTNQAERDVNDRIQLIRTAALLE